MAGGGGAKLVILVPVHSGDWSIRGCFNTLVSKEVTGDFFGPGDKLSELRFTKCLRQTFSYVLLCYRLLLRFCFRQMKLFL